MDSAELSHSLKRFGSSAKHAETSPESFGIVVCRSVGTVPGFWGSVWPSLRPKSGSNSRTPGRILKGFQGPFSSAVWTSPDEPSIVEFRSFVPGPRVYPDPDTMLRNTASGPEFGLPGQISAGFQSEKLQNRPSGRPKAGRMADFEAFRLESGRNHAREPDFRPGCNIAQHRV